MRTVRFALFVFFTAGAVSTVWGQYGLYGSPETLQLPAQETAPQQAATPVNYPTTAVPQTAAVPGYTYPAQPQQYSYPAQPQMPAQAYSYPASSPAQPQAVVPTYSYPAQPQAPTYAYPAQPQYRYPAQAQTTARPRYSAQVPNRYPVQPQPTTAYQPYQAGAQYRYPGPYAARTPMRTAAVEPIAPTPQPIPAPPGQPMPPAATGPMPSESPALQGQSLTPQPMQNQNYVDNGCGQVYGGNGCGQVYGGNGGCFEQSVNGTYPNGCGDNPFCEQDSYCAWYASVSALALGRSDGRDFWTSYRTGDEREQGGNTRFPMSWKWGGEVRIGRRFCCCCNPCALEAVYWTTDAFSGYRRTAYDGDTVNTVLSTNYITFLIPGESSARSADYWFQGAGQQTLERRDEFHNVEINLVREQLAWACDSGWDIGWSMGVRYFRFQESLVYDSVRVGGTRGGTQDAYFADEVTNNLIGFQVGFDAAYNVCNNLRLFITPKVGIYDNFMDNSFQAQLGNGVTNGYASPYNVYYPISGHKNAVAFLTQIDVGADYQFTRNWSARMGYRIVAITGIGLAEDQFPQYLTDVPQLHSVENSSSLILHGAFLGVTYNF